MPYQTGDFPVTADGREVGRVSISQNGLMAVFESACDYKSTDVLRLIAICSAHNAVLGVMIPDPEGILRYKKSFSKNALAEMGFSDPAEFRLARRDEIQSVNAPVAAPGDNHAAQPDNQKSMPDIQSAAGADDPPAGTHRDSRQKPADIKPAKTPAAGVRMPPFAVASPQPQKQESSSGNASAPETAAQDNDDSNEPSAPPDNISDIPDGWSRTDNPGGLFGDPDFAQICHGVKNALTKTSGDLVLLAVPVLQDEPFPMMPVFCFGDSGRIGGGEYIIFKIKNGKLAL